MKYKHVYIQQTRTSIYLIAFKYRKDIKNWIIYRGGHDKDIKFIKINKDAKETINMIKNLKYEVSNHHSEYPNYIAILSDNCNTYLKEIIQKYKEE